MIRSLRRLLTLAESVATSLPARTVRRRFVGRVELSIRPSAARGGPEADVEFEVEAWLRGSRIGRTAVGPLWQKLDIALPFSGGTYVERRYRGLGAGRALVGAAVTEAHRRGLTQLWTNIRLDNTRSIALYESLGFRPASAAEVLRALNDFHASGGPASAPQALWVRTLR